MSIFTLFIRGLKLAFGNRRLALRLWTVHFIFSLLVIAPLAFAIHGQLAHSLSGAAVLKKLDVHWLTDFSTRYQQATPLFLGLFLAAGLAFLLLAVFLNGGIIGGLSRSSARTTLADFFHDCGLYFWRFLRLFLLSIPVYLIIVGLLYRPLAGLLNSLARQAASEWPALIAGSLRLFALVLLLGLVSMFFDYVKIGLATRGNRKILKETWATLKFVAGRFFKAWGLFLLAGLAFVLLTLLYLEVARLLPQGTPLLVVAALLWQQLYVLGRQFSRMLFYATEIELSREIENGTVFRDK